jgi:hypothetical protein
VSVESEFFSIVNGAQPNATFWAGDVTPNLNAPFAILQIVGGDRESNLAGTVGNWRRVRVQVIGFSASFESALLQRDAIIAALRVWLLLPVLDGEPIHVFDDEAKLHGFLQIWDVSEETA